MLMTWKCPVCKESATVVINIETASSACPHCGAIIYYEQKFVPKTSFYDDQVKGKDSLDLWEYMDNKQPKKKDMNLVDKSFKVNGSEITSK